MHAVSCVVDSYRLQDLFSIVSIEDFIPVKFMCFARQANIRHRLLKKTYIIVKSIVDLPICANHRIQFTKLFRRCYRKLYIEKYLCLDFSKASHLRV